MRLLFTLEVFTFNRFLTIASYSKNGHIIQQLLFLDTVKETDFENRHSRTAFRLDMIFGIICQKFKVLLLVK